MKESGAPRSRRLAPLALGIILSGIGLIHAVPAHANGSRFELFLNYNNQIWRNWSDDNVSWHVFSQVPATPGDHCGYQGEQIPADSIGFLDSPAVVSDQPGRLWLVARAYYRYSLLYNVYTTDLGWRGWCLVPGGAEDWQTYRDAPKLTSWGPGRLDLFVHRVINVDAGPPYVGRALRHTWANNGAWAGTWETLGTGFMQGSPAAVSWGYRRIDVFARGGGNDLNHMWFANGNWSSWEYLGGDITGPPAVASPGPARLDVFARWSDGSLYHLPFAGGGWGSWNPDPPGALLSDAPIPTGGTLTPTVGSRFPGTLDVFFVGLNTSGSQEWYQSSFDGGGWSGFTGHAWIGPYWVVTYWEPVAPPPPPPDDGGGGCGPFPC